VYSYGWSEESHLDDGSKVLPVDEVLRLHVQVPELAGTHRVVLGVELVKALERLSSLQEEEGGRKGGRRQDKEIGNHCQSAHLGYNYRPYPRRRRWVSRRENRLSRSSEKGRRFDPPVCHLYCT